MVLAPQHKPVVTIHHKRRHGQHHKVTKHYTKTYWPYLPLLLIVGFGLVLNTLWSSGKGVLGYATQVAPATLLQQTNFERTSRGESALALNDQLAKAAQSKAEDMAKRNYWSHQTPNGQEPWVFISDTNYRYATAGENLAYGFDTSSATVAGWMNSPEHRSNILNDSYKDVGFGIAQAPSFQDAGATTIVVAFYASSVAPAVAAQEETLGYRTFTSAAQNQHQIARVQILTKGNATWGLIAVSFLTGAAIMIFVMKHALLWRRVLVRSEEFVIRHHYLDLLLVVVAVAGVLLLQNVGAVR